MITDYQDIKSYKKPNICENLCPNFRGWGTRNSSQIETQFVFCFIFLNRENHEIHELEYKGEKRLWLCSR